MSPSSTSAAAQLVDARIFGGDEIRRKVEILEDGMRLYKPESRIIPHGVCVKSAATVADVVRSANDDRMLRRRTAFSDHVDGVAERFQETDHAEEQ